MDIFYIANVRVPTEKAHGLQIAKMCEAFSECAVKVNLIVPRRLNNNRVDFFNYYKIKNNFVLTKILAIDPVFLMKFRNGWYIKIQSLFFLISLFCYLIFLTKKKEAVFYTRDIYLLSVLKLFSDNVIWEAHDLPHKASKYINILKKIKKIVAITSPLAKEIIGLGVVPQKVKVFPDGVDFAEFSNIKETKGEVRARLNLPQDKKIVIYTGHLYDWKGVQTLANTSELLPEDYLIVFVGGTTEDVKKFKNINSDKSNIVITGAVAHELIPFYLKAADVAILPNSAKLKISEKYTSPLKLFEYMASGVPIVASNLESLRDVLNDQNCLFFEADNYQSLASAIIKICQSTDLAKSISVNGKEIVKNLTWEKRAQAIVSFINL